MRICFWLYVPWSVHLSLRHGLESCSLLERWPRIRTPSPWCWLPPLRSGAYEAKPNPIRRWDLEMPLKVWGLPFSGRIEHNTIKAMQNLERNKKPLTWDHCSPTSNQFLPLAQLPQCRDNIHYNSWVLWGQSFFFIWYQFLGGRQIPNKSVTDEWVNCLRRWAGKKNTGKLSNPNNWSYIGRNWQPERANNPHKNTRGIQSYVTTEVT